MIRQSFSWWPFANKGLKPEALLAGAREIGYEAVDLIEEELWPLAKAAGLRISAIAGHASIEDGLNRSENTTRIEAELRANIVKAADWEIPVLICFAGNRGRISWREGLETCAATLARVAPLAESAGVTLAVELLNSKIDHPDYQCDQTLWGVTLCNRVHSPAVKLLYDIYHMQIMEGDIIRTIQRCHEWFAHYHTAGNPGRGQPDATQEIFYPAIYRAIAATGYKGFVSHEFLPSVPPLEALRLAFEDCASA